MNNDGLSNKVRSRFKQTVVVQAQLDQVNIVRLDVLIRETKTLVMDFVSGAPWPIA